MTATDPPKTRREITARLNEIAPYPDQNTPGHAQAVAKYLAVLAQRRWKYLDMTSTADMDSIEYRLTAQAMVAEFAALRLLMSLINNAPEWAEDLSRRIRDAWDAGGDIGEWLWECESALGIDPEEVSRLEEAWRVAPGSATAATTGEQA